MPARTRHEGADQLLAYEALAALNQGFVAILENLRRLKELGILHRDLGTALTVAMEETRAWANFEITEPRTNQVGKIGPSAAPMGREVRRSQRLAIGSQTSEEPTSATHREETLGGDQKIKPWVLPNSSEGMRMATL
jgi:hypothetical protein